MKKLIVLLVVLSSVILSGCETSSDKVVVLTSSGYEPYEMVDTDGSLIGFDIDLMEALALEVGIEIEWKDVAFDGIIAALQSGQADIAIAGISPTEERKEMVDFSDVYYNSDSGLLNFMVFDSSNSYASLSDLNGAVVGAQLGTVQAGLLENLNEEYGFTVDLRNTNTQIVEEIKSGRIDVLIVESLIADSIIENNPSFVKVGFESYLDDTMGNAIAFSKDSGYQEAFNEALQTLIENGTMQELIDKWFN